jgi:hypothetical protein
MKTAVEWLVEQVNSDCLNSTFIRPELIEQAKEMEKEQMESAYLAGESKDKQYYKETFKSEL